MEQQAISSDLIRGHIDTIILHTLLSGDKFAQQISDAIEEKSENEYKINQATLYSSLKRLETLKYVTSYWYDSDAGGRRKFFKLTESGKETVESNLSNWSFSRAIIDKLMDCAPQPIYRTQYIEKTIEIPKEVSPIVEPKTIDTDNSEKKQQEIQKNSVSDGQSVQEINFRNILNGLIKSNTVQKQATQTEIKPLQKTVEAEETEKAKFNETLQSTDYNEQRSNNGKIDFGDLTLKAAKEGYKIRISSKDSSALSGTLLVNKLNVFSSLTIYFVVMVEYLIYSLAYGTVLKPSVFATLLIMAVLTVFPVVNAVRYAKEPKKHVSKRISVDSVLTAAIVVFNLLLINLAAALLFNLDFGNAYSAILYVAIPITIYIDVLLYYIIRFFIAKLNFVHVKRKKTA